MPNTVTNTTILDGTKRRVFLVSITGDGSGDETNLVIYDYSADGNAPSSAAALSVEQIWHSQDAVNMDLSWDGATDLKIWTAPNNSEHPQDFRDFGGLKNLAGTPTGDLLLSTTGLGANEHIVLIVDLRKS